MTHTPSSLHVSGGIDGTIKCEGGWSKYTTFPGRGWGRKSIGIKRDTSSTKSEYISRKLTVAFAKHVVRNA